MSYRIALCICWVLATGAALGQVAKRAVDATAPTAADARDAGPDTLLLKTAIFDPVSEVLVAKGGIPGVESKRYGLVQLHAGAALDPALLGQAGAEVVDFIPNRAFVVRWDPDSRRRIEKLASVRYAGPLNSLYKIGPQLLAPAGQKSIGARDIEIIGFPGTRADHLEATVGKLFPAARMQWSEDVAGRAWVRLSLPEDDLGEAVGRIAAMEDVAWIDQYLRPEVENADSVGPIQANAPSGGLPPTATPIWDQGIIGTGQVVAVVDSGVDRNQKFFARLSDGTTVVEEYTNAEDTLPPTPGTVYPRRKIYGYFVQPGASPYDGTEECGGGRGFFHGTHVASTAAGDQGDTATPTEPNYDDGDGMAPNAQILAIDIGNDESGCLTGVSFSTYEQIVRAGAFIASNSFGSPVVDADGEIIEAAQIYAFSDHRTDLVTHQFERLLFVKSAGNDGAAGETTLSHPAYAKNGLAVTALEHGNDPNVASFSSRGPTFDGRIKPDIGAPGVDIRSAAGNDRDNVPPPQFGGNAIGPKSGTSMATPAVSGAAALARQYFVDGFYPSGTRNPDDALIPSGALLKAVLLNGTRLYGNTPASDSGWGRVWLDNNLYFAGDDRQLRVWSLGNLSGMRTGETHEFQVQVDAGREFRATLVWYDPPGSLFTSGPVLVNNLDLVVDTGDQVFRGNNFRGGTSTAGGGRDALNNVEQVILPSPQAGTYTIRVRGDSIPGNGTQNTDRQGYALVVSSPQCSTGVSTAPDFELTTTDEALQLDISGASGASDYQIYRAQGSCTTPAGEYQFVGATRTTRFDDLTTQGGFEYAYRARGVDACGEGPASSCKSAVSNAACKLLPTFDQDSVEVRRADNGSCSVDISWDPGQASCPDTELRYTIYRSTDPFFEPGAGDIVASGVDGASYTDVSVDPLTTYYYVVKAEDTSGGGSGPNGGNQSLAATRYAVTTIGNQSTPGEFVDDPDTLSVVTFDPPWQLTEQASSTGRFSYRNAAEGETYPPDTCARIVTPAIQLQDGSPTLSYDARFDLEADWDGIVVEISTDGGASWQDLPPDQGYPGDFSMTEPNGTPINACGYPKERGAFNGEQQKFETYTSDLSAFAGQDALLRWSFSSDPGLEFEGFFLDNIRVSDASMPGACTAVESPKSYSGPWFNAEQSGHGWLIEQLDGAQPADPDRINAYWYVYRGGNPVWLIGQGDLVDNQAQLDVFVTDGADFPPDFEADDVNLSAWGSLLFEFSGDTDGTASWDSLLDEFGSGSLAIQQLAPIADSPDACHSGSYYNLEQNGHGFVAEVFSIGGELQVLVAWYVYLNGEQVWLLGQAPLIDDRAEIPMGRFSGADFPPQFDPAAVVNEAWGTLTIEFTGADSAAVAWTSMLTGFGSGQLDLARLTTLKGRSCP